MTEQKDKNLNTIDVELALRDLFGALCEPYSSSTTDDRDIMLFLNEFLQKMAMVTNIYETYFPPTSKEKPKESVKKVT